MVFLIGLITKHGQVPYGKREHGKKAIIYIWLIGGKRNLQRLQDQEECWKDCEYEAENAKIFLNLPMKSMRY